MSKRKQENKGRTLLTFFWKRLLTDVESESAKLEKQSRSITSEEQAGSSQDNESQQEKYKHEFQHSWLEKFTW